MDDFATGVSILNVLFKRAVTIGCLSVALAGCGQEIKCDDSSESIKQVDGTDPEAFNHEAVTEKIAQRFIIGGDINLASVRLYIRRVGSPNGTLRIWIQEDENGRPHPDNDPIENGGPETKDIAGLELSDTVLEEVTITFPDHPELDSGKDYFLVVDIEGDDVDDLNHLKLGAVSEALAYADIVP